MTTCGCCECIAAVLPMCNGVMTVNRDYTGMTPCGMKFTTLAGSSAAARSPRALWATASTTSPSGNSLVGDGGLKRLVWMPKILKEEIRERLNKRAEEAGHPRPARPYCR